MKNKLTKIGAVLLACMVGITPVFACTTTPRDINTSRPGDKPAKPERLTLCLAQQTTPSNIEPSRREPAKVHQNRGAFVIDNFKVIQGTLEKLGISPGELEGMIKQGKTLSDVLNDKKINVNRFQKTLLKQYYCTVKEAVDKGQITKQEAKTLKAAIKQKVMSWQPKR